MKTRIYLAFVVWVMFSGMGEAQQQLRTTDFTTFKKWSSQIVINGYKQGETEDEGSNFIANYFSGTSKLIQISVSDVSSFKFMAAPGQASQKYQLGGNNAVYFATADNSLLAVEYKNVELCVSVAITGKVERVFLENILTKANPTQLYNLSSGNSDLKWPSSIPASFRLTTVVSIEKTEPDGDYKEMYELKAKFSNELIDNLKRLMEKFDTSSLSESLHDGKAQLICLDGETIDQLMEQFKPGQQVKFMVYIK